MSGFSAFLQQAGAWLATAASAEYSTATAVFTGTAAPARQVALCTLALIVLLVYAPRILKKLTK